MTTQIAATFVGGVFKPDEMPPLAEDTRVNLTIEAIENDSEEEPVWDPDKARAAWQELKAFLKEHPIHGGGKRFNRDELYERR